MRQLFAKNCRFVESDWYSEYLDFAIPAFRLTHSGVKPETQIHTHMCYSEFNDIIKAIDDMDADVITFEASRSDLQILDALRDNHFETEVSATWAYTISIRHVYRQSKKL